MAVQDSPPTVSPAAFAWLDGETPPRRCPRCGRPDAFRIPARLDDEMTLQKYYRCGREGRFVYVHRIRWG